MRAVCILGSPKKEGNTATILKEVTGVFENNSIQTKVIYLGNANIKFCTGCKKCEEAGKCVQDDDMNRIIEEIQEADLVLLASPSYWGDVTAQMKQFIDRCTPYCNNNANRLPFPMEKHGVAIAVRAGQNQKENETLLSTMEHFLGHLDIPLEYKFTVEGVDTKDDLLNKPFELERARKFGNEIVKSLELARNI